MRRHRPIDDDGIKIYDRHGGGAGVGQAFGGYREPTVQHWSDVMPVFGRGREFGKHGLEEFLEIKSLQL